MSSAASMEVSFILAEDEFRACAKHAEARVQLASKYRSRLSTLSGVYYLLLFMAIVAFLFFVTENPDVPMIHLCAAVLFLAIRVPVRSLYHWRAGAMRYNVFLQDFRSRDDLVRVSIDESGMKTDSEFLQQSIRWNIFRDVCEFENLLLFYFDTSASICVPVRAFDSKDAAGRFLEFARGQMAATS